MVPELNVYYETGTSGFKFTAQFTGTTGKNFALFANPVKGAPIFLGAAPIGTNLEFAVSNSMMSKFKAPVRLTAMYKDGAQVLISHPADLFLGVANNCDVLDFNYTIGDDTVMQPGAEMTSQWSDIGLQISARNNNPTHPDKAILFDSSSPTGGDVDLLTPNPMAIGNTTAFGNVLIVAENDVDTAPTNGFVDDPDDEGGGGSLYFDFADKAAVCSVTLIDIDENPGTELRFYRNGDLATPDETFTIVSLGDGSVQRVDFLETDLDRFEVYFAGSGAIAGVDLIPCPRVINFDETSTGIPRNFMAGEQITNQFANLGVLINVVNNDPQHPDKGILFDSEDRTGGDDDLLTPNPNVPSNNKPLGFVLIIAENDIDVAPADGFVDDPDDEFAGGEIRFRFNADVTFMSANVLDVDDNEIDFWRFYDAADNQIGSILIPDAADGNVQLVTANISGVRRAVLELGGSGAVTNVKFCPDSLISD